MWTGPDIFRSFVIGVCACYVMMAILCGVRLYHRWQDGATIVRVPVKAAALHLIAFAMVSLYATIELVNWIRVDEPIHWFRSPLLLAAFIVACIGILLLVNFTYPGVAGEDETQP